VTTALAASLDAGRQCRRLLGLAQARLGAGLTGFEVMNRFSLALVRRHFPQAAAAAAGRRLDGAAGAVRHRGRSAGARNASNRCSRQRLSAA
jgi:hypothetical protein